MNEHRLGASGLTSEQAGADLARGSVNLKRPDGLRLRVTGAPGS
jgi:hypothetical protein